jgi:hypothetical protein
MSPGSFRLASMAYAHALCALTASTWTEFAAASNDVSGDSEFSWEKLTVDAA